MIVIYKKHPEKTILKEAEKAKGKIAKWFKDNPKRKICNAAVWYDKTVTIKRNSIDADIDKAAKQAIEG